MRVIKFLISGGMAAATDLVLLFIFVHWFGMYYLLSSILAFIGGMIVSFLMQKYFTFNDYSQDKIRKQTLLYAALHTLNLCLNTLLMYVSVDLLGISYLIAQTIIIALLATSNFFTSKHLVFTPDTVYNKSN